jgi:ketosteroid isomerase-like protein
MTQPLSLADITARLDRLEQRDAVRAVVDEYFERCDLLGPNSDIVALGALFTQDAVWRGAGSRYAKSFGEHRGRAAIIAFLSRYASPRFFESNVHLLTSERLVVNAETATGTWQMLQMPSFVDGSAWLLVAKIEVQLTYADGGWRISAFTTRNLISKNIEGGWQASSILPVPSGEDH